MFFLTSTVAFSQHTDGKYSFKNNQGMICNLVFSDDGWKVSIDLIMGKVAPNKILKGDGKWFNQGGGQWYQINTNTCSFDFDVPTNKLTISIYDCDKSGLKEAKYVLTKI